MESAIYHAGQRPVVLAMRTTLEWYEWMRCDSPVQIGALEAEDRLIARLLEDGETFEDNSERIESLRR